MQGANLESHELKVMGKGHTGHPIEFEEAQGSSSTSAQDSTNESHGTYVRDTIMTLSIDSTGSTSNGRLVTMTGTIKRGQKVGEMVEVQLQLSEDELSKLQQSYIEDEKVDDSCVWGLDKGLHIVLLTLLCIPFAFLASVAMSFYIGSIAWYNVFINLSEERTVWHKIFLCPILIFTFPIFIVLSALCIGLYASIIQVRILTIITIRKGR